MAVPMNAGLKWIGGGTLAALALIVGGMAVGSTLEAGEAPARAAAAPAITAADVLAGDDAATAAADGIAANGDYGGADPVSAAQRAAAEPMVPHTPGEPLVIRRVLPISGPIRYGEWHWDDAGVPEGPLVITVDLQARVISVFRSGYEIGAAAALLGTPAHPTPVGTFPILTKERHNVSEKYNNAPMPWTLRLTWDGVAIHGGSTVERGYASHGCVGVPDEFAARLFEIARVGDRVIVTDGVRTGVGGSLAG